MGTLYDIHADGRLNHQFEVTGGVREEECVALLRGFFAPGARSRCQILDEVWPVFSPTSQPIYLSVANVSKI